MSVHTQRYGTYDAQIGVDYGVLETTGKWTGFHSPSSGLYDFYSAGTKAIGFDLDSTDPRIVGYTQDLHLETDVDSKQVKLNARDYTQASGDSIGFVTVPNQTVNTTGEVYGGQIKPRAAAGIDVGSVNGLGIDSELKSGDGNASADVRGINMYLGATGTGTITGDVLGLRLRAEVSATVSGHITGLDIDNHEGSKAWNCLVKFGAALGTHSMTTNADKTGNSVVGSIKVIHGTTLVHLPLYADS